MKKAELEIQYLISLRNNYTACIIVLTGGLATMLLSKDFNILNIMLLLLGIVLDFSFIKSNNKIMKRVYDLLEDVKNE